MPYPARAHKRDFSPVPPLGTPTHGMMELLRLVGAPQDEDFNKFTRLVTRALHVPVALVSFVQEEQDRQYFKTQIGLTGRWAVAPQTPMSHSFCQIVKKDDRPLVIENAPKDTRLRQHGDTGSRCSRLSRSADPQDRWLRHGRALCDRRSALPMGKVANRSDGRSCCLRD